MRRVLLAAALCAALSALAAPAARARGGSVAFDGGTAAERATVQEALDASSFPWSVLPGTVVVHIAANAPAEALPGEIWLDPGLLDTGVFSWATVQHELGHEVDMLLLDDAARQQLAAALGGTSWWLSPGQEHATATAERFASTLSWAYWPSRRNALRPHSPADESAAMRPRAFRALLAQLLHLP